MSAYPKDFTISGLGPGERPTTRIVYQCESREDAMQEVHRAASLGGTVQAEYREDTMELVLVFS